MFVTAQKICCSACALLLLCGCSPVALRQTTRIPATPATPVAATPLEQPASASLTGILEPLPSSDEVLAGSANHAGVQPVSALEPLPPIHPDRLKIPSALPGADAPPIQLPPFDKTSPKERQQALDKLYPNLPGLGVDPRADANAPTGELTLDQLEKIAHDNSPVIRQALGDLQAANGNAIQAGTYPNPSLGLEGDTMGTGGTGGYQGGFVEQVIKTGHKLQIGRAAAMLDVANAQVALSKADTDLRTAVRTGYFNVVVAQENIKISRALSEFSDESYRVQVDMVKGGQAAAYEPLQLRVQAYQARANLLQARNRYTSAWKQLAATLGLTGMPATPVKSLIDAPVPLVKYDAALTRVLTSTSEVVTADNSLRQARLNLRLAEVNRIPDVTAHVAVQHDYTTAPFNTVATVVISAPIPMWDQNRGNIMAAEGALTKASEGPHKARADLTQKLADAYERYDNNLQLVEYYRTQILPDQIQAYRGVHARHQQEPDVVAFNDVVTAQQTLAQTATSYVTALGAQWQAVIDLAGLMEAEDMFQIGELQHVACVPNLEALCPLPCCHPCSNLPDPRLKGGDGAWPPAAPERQAVR